MRRNKTKLYPDNTWLWLGGANLLLCLAFLLFFIIVTWLSIGSAQAWEFQLPIKLEDEEKKPIKPSPAAPPKYAARIPSAKQRRRPLKSNPTRYPL